MPNNIIQSFADKSGKDVGEVDKLWKRAEEIVKKDYPKIAPDSDNFYQILVGVLKKMLKLEDAAITTTSANIGDGQSGQFKKRMFATMYRSDKKKKKKKSK